MTPLGKHDSDFSTTLNLVERNLLSRHHGNLVLVLACAFHPTGEQLCVFFKGFLKGKYLMHA